MKKIVFLGVFLLLVGLLLTGCGLNDMATASADDIQRKSIEAAADAQAKRQQDIIDRAEARAQAAQAAQAFPWPLFVMCTAGFAMLGGVVGGLWLATNIRPQLPASQVISRPVRYPVFLQPVGSGQYQMTDDLSGKTFLIDVRTVQGRALLESLRGLR